MTARPALTRLAVAVALLPVLAACGEGECAQSAEEALWAAYADNLGTGSRLRKAEGFYGDIEVAWTKAADPPAGSSAPYPYAGLIVYLAPDRRGVPFPAAAARLQLEYRLSGPVQIQLEQDGIAHGDEFRVDLPPATTWRKVEIPLSAAVFRQPAWTRQAATLTGHRLIGIKFHVAAPQDASAELHLANIQIAGAGCIRARR